MNAYYQLCKVITTARDDAYKYKRIEIKYVMQYLCFNTIGPKTSHGWDFVTF